MPVARLNPTLFDKLVADLDLEGLRETSVKPIEASRSSMRFYTVPRIERFNEAALRATVMRELNWLLNTTSLDSLVDLEPYPEVKTSVLNFGVRDLAGKTLTQKVVQERGRHMRDSIRAFEPRLDPSALDVDTIGSQRENAITYRIRSDITAAVEAMPVEFKTDIELDTAAATIRE